MIVSTHVPMVLTKKQLKQRDYRPPPLPSININDVSCPPCEVTVQRACLGGHQIRTVPCHTEKEFSCGDPCGNPLPCGNHKCELTCHPISWPRRWIKNERGQVTAVELVRGLGNQKDTCAPCEEPCVKPRDPPCPHPCPRPCHPGTCSPCDVRIKKKCYCKKMPVYLSCFQTHDVKLVSSLRSCGHQCLKPLPSCNHLCTIICHEGPCSQKCKQKVKVRCTCGNRVEKWVCEDAQLKKEEKGPARDQAKGHVDILLECTPECAELQKKRDAERLEEEQKKEELRRRKEKEKIDKRNAIQSRKKANGPTAKRTSPKWREDQEIRADNRTWWVRFALVAIIVLLLAVIVALLDEREWSAILWYLREVKWRFQNVNLWGRKRQ